MDNQSKVLKKVLVFHPTVAPYRIDFFNDLYKAFDTRISLYYRNLKTQKFPEKVLLKNLIFEPDFFIHTLRIFFREIPIGFISRLKIYNPDIVIVNEYSESYWISMLYRLISGKKYKIITICDDSLDIAKKSSGIHALARKLALKNMDGVILCNDSAKEKYNVLFPKIKTVVMPIIQDENRYFLDRNEAILQARKILIKESLINKRVFLFVGRIAPEKNILYLVKSFIANHKEHPENVLYIIGDNTPQNNGYNNQVDELIKNSSAQHYIRKIGRKDGIELKAWYYASQVFVLPSIFEPFGAVTNEALLCGDYVMITSVAGSTCLVDDSNGEIINVSNSEINFSKSSRMIPKLTEEYVLNKRNKMNCSYRKCINSLMEWINNI